MHAKDAHATANRLKIYNAKDLELPAGHTKRECEIGYGKFTAFNKYSLHLKKQ